MSEEITVDSQEEDLSKYIGDEGFCLRWLKEISLVEQSKERKAYETIGERIVKKYKNQSALDDYKATASPTGRVMFNVLWSNVQVLLASLFSRMPKTVVERRFKDSDPVGRLASQLAERATSFMKSTQQDRYMHAVRAALLDRLLPGAGNVRVIYEPNLEDGETTDGNTQKVLTGKETILVKYDYWEDVYQSQARNQYEIRFKFVKVYMTRAELVKRFGEEIGNKCDLNYNPTGKKLTPSEANFLRQAEVYEIEDKVEKLRIWVSKGYKKGPLDVKPDILRLKEFFSSPDPLLATVTTDSMYPTPDFVIYERLAEELDYIIKRMSAITECVRIVGATAKQFYEKLKAIYSLPDGQLAAVDNWQQFAEKGGLQGIIDWAPFDKAAAALPILADQADRILSRIHEITGIPDIVRGAGDPEESATMSRNKMRWVGVKQEEKSRDVQRFCRQIDERIAEILFEEGLFLDQTIFEMCGVAQMPPEDQQNFGAALALLRNDRLRTFRVDIETDSTIAVDETLDQAARMEYVNAYNQLLGSLQNISQFRPELIDPTIETIMFAVRGFRTARPVEGSLERAMQMIEDNDAAAKEAAAQQPPPPDYEQMKVQNESQKIQIDAQNEAQRIQIEGQKAQNDMMLGSQRLQMDYELGSQKIQVEASKSMSESQMKQLELELEQFKTQFMQQIEVEQLKLEDKKITLSEKEKMLTEIRLQQEAQEKKEENIEKANTAKGGGGAVNIKLHPTQGVQVHHNTINPKEKKSRRKFVKIRRTPDGLEGMSEDLPDEPEVVA